MCVCQKIVWSIEFNPALRESPTKTERAPREGREGEIATTETRGKERARENGREREGGGNARATRATEETRETSRTHPVVCTVRKLSAC